MFAGYGQDFSPCHHSFRICFLWNDLIWIKFRIGCHVACHDLHDRFEVYIVHVICIGKGNHNFLQDSKAVPEIPISYDTDLVHLEGPNQLFMANKVECFTHIKPWQRKWFTLLLAMHNETFQKHVIDRAPVHFLEPHLLFRDLNRL
ncbi:unnamed protein product [Lepeophtheirus salmonis]|uniref:(salmon louse) hypothetical protein n=1 Tax=Lepeophtheirus salmonis TaxID=72036 RepID=A0A7R8CGL1_LEPSM|nr:unnamed protein product [Lepeophtheirus salmonis]CAF2816950.1 unnamed protein product [Lepeophtheirus salmonis]